MTEDTIPLEVREFLLECVDTVAQLEALLLLRESPQREWDIPSLARRLYIGEAEARSILSSLMACGLVRSDGSTFCYQPQEPIRQSLVESVALTYARCLVPVTRLIHDKASGVRKFADAFKFRKDK